MRARFEAPRDDVEIAMNTNLNLVQALYSLAIEIGQVKKEIFVFEDGEILHAKDPRVRENESVFECRVCLLSLTTGDAVVMEEEVGNAFIVTIDESEKALKKWLRKKFFDH